MLIQITFAFASLVILLPIIYFLPLNLSRKGLVLVAGIAFLLAMIGIASLNILALWQTGLILVLLILLLSYFLENRLSPILYSLKDDHRGKNNSSYNIVDTVIDNSNEEENSTIEMDEDFIIVKEIDNEIAHLQNNDNEIENEIEDTYNPDEKSIVKVEDSIIEESDDNNIVVVDEKREVEFEDTEDDVEFLEYRELDLLLEVDSPVNKDKNVYDKTEESVEEPYMSEIEKMLQLDEEEMDKENIEDFTYINEELENVVNDHDQLDEEILLEDIEELPEIDFNKDGVLPFESTSEDMDSEKTEELMGTELFSDDLDELDIEEIKVSEHTDSLENVDEDESQIEPLSEEVLDSKEEVQFPFGDDKEIEQLIEDIDYNLRNHEPTQDEFIESLFESDEIAVSESEDYEEDCEIKSTQFEVNEESSDSEDNLRSDIGIEEIVNSENESIDESNLTSMNSCLETSDINNYEEQLLEKDLEEIDQEESSLEEHFELEEKFHENDEIDEVEATSINQEIETPQEIEDLSGDKNILKVEELETELQYDDEVTNIKETLIDDEIAEIQMNPTEEIEQEEQNDPSEEYVNVEIESITTSNTQHSELQSDIVTKQTPQKTKLQQQLFHTMVAQIRISRKSFTKGDYEKLVTDHLHPDLSAQDYYTFASLLIEHYIKEQQYEKLCKLLEDLQSRFSKYPILQQEIEYLHKQYCEK